MSRPKQQRIAAPTEISTRSRRKVQQTGLLLQIATKVAAAETLEELLRYIVEVSVQQTAAERGTLFLNDEKKGELFSRVAMGASVGEIRLPNTAGIAGAVFTTGQAINIPYAYADLRFNPSFDKRTGYFTRSILCVPIVNKNGKTIGVTQVLNKRGGPFTAGMRSG